MSLLDLPAEIQMRLMLYLDLDSINSYCKVSSVIEAVCNDDWFWRRKVAKEYPRLPLDLPDGATFKDTFRLLNYPNYWLPIQLDRADIIQYNEHDGIGIDPIDTVELAVDSSSPSVLRWALSILDDDDKDVESFYMTKAIQRGDTELVKIFMENVPIISRHLVDAALAGEFEIERLLLERVDAVHLTVLTTFGGRLISLSRQKQRDLKEGIRLIDEEGLLSPNDEATTAILLDDAERLRGLRPPAIIVEYGFRYGSPEIVKELVDQGHSLGRLDSLDITRVKELLRLGVKIDPVELLCRELNVRLVLFLVDVGAIDPNMAVVILIVTFASLPRRDAEQLEDGLLDRRRNGEISFDIDSIQQIDPSIPREGVKRFLD